MYVRIDQVKYYEIKNIKFCPEVDMTGSTCPICELTVDVRSTTDFDLYTWISLWDNDDRLWCNYLIKDQERLSPDFIRVTGASQLCLVEFSKVMGALYLASDGATTTDIAVGYFPGLYYTLDSTLANLSIIGYGGPGNLRDNIHKFLFGMGAYLRQSFSDTLDILPRSDSMKLVPFKRTFATPSYEEGDYYKQIRMWICGYNLIEGEPTATQEYIEYGGHYYEKTGAYTYLNNPNPIYGGGNNVLDSETFFLVNSDYMLPMNTLALYFYGTARLDCLNEREFLPGERVCFYLDKQTLMCGWIQKADFKFGHSVRSTLYLIGCETVPVSGEYTVVYIDSESDDELYRESELYFPRGWTYVFTPKPVIDVFRSDTLRFIARPTISTLTGTFSASDTTLTVPCLVDLEYITDYGYLTTLGVDDITESSYEDAVGDTVNVIEIQGGGSTAVHESDWEVTYA